MEEKGKVFWQVLRYIQKLMEIELQPQSFNPLAPEFLFKF
jgi:hypothetical protein